MVMHHNRLWDSKPYRFRTRPKTVRHIIMELRRYFIKIAAFHPVSLSILWRLPYLVKYFFKNAPASVPHAGSGGCARRRPARLTFPRDSYKMELRSF